MSAKTRQDEIADELWERADKIGWERAAVEISGALATAEQTAEQRGHDLAAAQKLVVAAEQRAEEWREEAWRCYVESGCDPDGADARHLNPGEAIEAVKELRQQSDENGDEAAEAERLLAIARSALERIRDEVPKMDRGSLALLNEATYIARKALAQLNPQGGSGE